MHEILDWLWRLVAAECLIAAWGFAAFAIANRLLPVCGVALRWTATGVVGLWLVTVAFHLLLALEAFALIPGLVLALATALSAFLACGRTVAWNSLTGDLRSLPERFRASGHPARRLMVLGSVIALVTVALRSALIPVVAWDSLTYHAVKSAMWVQRGGPLSFVAPGGFDVYRDYPGGGELLHAWAMLPFRSDLLTGALDGVLWLLLGVAVHALGGQFALGQAARWTAAVYVLAVPAAARAAGSLYVDNVLAFTIVAACALALYTFRRGSAGSLVLACMSLGVGIGIKIFALPVAAGAALSVGVLWLSRSRPGNARRLIALAAGGVVLSLAAAPWFVANYLRVGYPMSPFPVEIAGFTLGRATPALIWYMDRPFLVDSGLGDELRALAHTFGVPGLASLDQPTLGVVSMAVLLVACVSLVRLARRDWRSALVTFAFAAPMALSYSGVGMKTTRLIWASVSGRYLLAVLALCVVVSLTCCRRRGPWQAGYQALLGCSAAAYLVASDVRGWTVVEALTASGGAIAIVGMIALSTSVRPRRAAMLLPLILLAGPGLLEVYRGATRDHALRHSMALHASPRYWLPALPAVDEPAHPRTLAVTAGARQNNDNWLLYPFLGRRLQNTLVYVPVTADGAIVDLSDNQARVARASYTAWRERLIRRGVSEVVSFSPQSLELYWMEQNPAGFHRLAGDGQQWGVYQVMGGQAPGG